MADRISGIYIEISATASKLVNEVGRANKSLSLLEQSAKNLQNTMMGMFGIQALYNGIKTTINIVGEFDKQMASLKAISGSTSIEMDRLKNSALSIGSASLYSAKQVGELQVEFARLGFSTKEILNATSATVDLAAATGESLSRSAEIAGSTLRAFNLDASEMGRVTDTISEGLNRSGLTLDSFADAIKYVAPVAASANVSLEETTAMLGILADAGIKASQGGTSLRRIFTLLTADGRPLQERLKELADAGITLADANDEVGLYAQNALLILARELDQVNKLTEGIRSATGVTKELAAVTSDNLGAAVDRLNNSWQSLLQGSSGLTNFFRGLVGIIQSQIDMASGQALVTGAFTKFGLEIGKVSLESDKGRDILEKYKKELIDLSKQGLNIDKSVYDLTKLSSEYKNSETVLKAFLEITKQLKTEQDNLNKTYETFVTKGLGVSFAPVINSTSLAVEGLGVNIAQLIALREKPSVDAIGTWINELTKKIGESNSRGEIEQFQKRIEKLTEAKNKLLGIVDMKKVGEEAMGLGISAGFFDNFGKPKQQDNAKILQEGENAFQASALENFQKFFPEIEKVDQATKNMTDSWIQFGLQAGNAIAGIISSDKDLGASIKKTAAMIIQQNATVIASWLAAKFAKDSATKTPVAAIAALTVGLGVVAGLLGKDWKASKSSTSGSSGSGRISMSRNSTQVNGVIKGQDIYISNENYFKYNRSTSFISG